MLFVNLSLLVLLTSAAIAGKEDPSTPKLELAFSGSLPDNVHPFLDTTDEAVYLRNLVQEPLFTYNDQEKNPKLHCNLCKVTPSFENSGLQLSATNNNRLQINFEISEEARWNDGHPVSGLDLDLAWQVGQAAAREGVGIPIWRRITKIRVYGERNQFVSLDFGDGKYLFDDLRDIFLLPAHLEGPIWQHVKQDFSRYLLESNYLLKPTEAGLYNGAHSIDQLSPSGARLKAAQPTTGRFAIQILPDISPARLASVDIVPEYICWQLDCSALAAKKATRSIETDSTRLELLLFNLRNPLFRDRNLRQALRQLIDRDSGMYNSNFGQKLVPANSFVPTTSSYFSAKIPFWPTDLAKAKSLLSASGWKLNDRNLLEKDGQTMNIELRSDDTPFRQFLAREITRSIEQAGIHIDFKPQPASAYFSQTIKRLQFVGLALVSFDLRLDADFSLFIGDQAVPNVHNDYEGQNYSAWSHPRAKDFLEQLSKEFDTERRFRIMEQLQTLYLQEHPSIPLGFYRKRALINPDLEGFLLPSSPQASSVHSRGWKLAIPTPKAVHATADGPLRNTPVR